MVFRSRDFVARAEGRIAFAHHGFFDSAIKKMQSLASNKEKREVDGFSKKKKTDFYQENIRKEEQNLHS